MKKIKSLIALALVFAMLAAYAPFASAVKLKPGLAGKPNTGDVDNKGDVTAADARLVLRYCAKLESFNSDQLKAADVDRDGYVTPLDARAILRIAAGLDMSANIDLTYRSEADQAIRDAIEAYNTAATKIKSKTVQKNATVEQTINTKADISLSWALKLFLRSLGQDPSELEQGFTYPADRSTYYLDSNGLVKALPPEGSNAVDIPLDAQTIYGMLKTDQQCELFFNPENFSNDSVYTKALPVKDFAKLDNPFDLMDDAGGDLNRLIEIESKSLKYNGGSLFYELDSEGNLTKATYYCQAVATYKMEFLETSTFTMDMKITIDITQEFIFSDITQEFIFS
ncbi:MAG TPA: dockerin type I repeat-containing protein [Clostridiales bacterium]|nr:dockerin type I repeat-containing protein [Clostridiales bacterium]